MFWLEKKKRFLWNNLNTSCPSSKHKPHSVHPPGPCLINFSDSIAFKVEFKHLGVALRSFVIWPLSRPLSIPDGLQSPQCITSSVIVLPNGFPPSGKSGLSNLCLPKSLKTQLKGPCSGNHDPHLPGWTCSFLCSHNILFASPSPLALNALWTLVYSSASLTSWNDDWHYMMTGT